MTLIEGGLNGALPKICKHSQSLLMLLVGQATEEMGRERKKERETERESERETKK